MGVKNSVKELKLIHAIKMKFFFAVFVAATSALEMTPDALAAMGILSDSTFMEWAASEIGSDAVTSDGVDLAALLGGSAPADAVAADAAVVAAVDAAADVAADATADAVAADAAVVAAVDAADVAADAASDAVADAVADVAADVAVDNAALEACTNAQNELNASDNGFESLGLKMACDTACADIEGETCGFLVNGVSFALVALLAFLRN